MVFRLYKGNIRPMLHRPYISIIHLENSDVVRNPLVQKIIERYAKVE